MSYPQQQQNMSFPDTIAVCLDEDKSLVCRDLFNIEIEEIFRLVNMFL
jgi:hypothetical protein